MTLKKSRAPLIRYFKHCASFCSHRWIQTGVMVRKGVNWVLTSGTWNFDLWPWPFAWISLLLLVITPEIFMMIRWKEHSAKGVIDRRMDGWTHRQTERQTEPFIKLLKIPCFNFFQIQNLCHLLLAGHCRWAPYWWILWEHKTGKTQQCTFLFTTKFMSLATSSAFFVVILLLDFMSDIKLDWCQLTSEEAQSIQPDCVIV